MRLYLFLIILVLLTINANAFWQTYQNDLRNTGAANGTGYFPLRTANFSDDSIGMDFQPLVDDLDRNGNNEIVIFSNNSLVIFNPQLDVLTQTKVGSILGQPALFNFDDDNPVEIIFNSRQNLTDYFFVYQYNESKLNQEFNITLPYEANFSGIKCLNLNGTDSCVFKDEKNYIHVINLSSKADSFYNTSIYDEIQQTVPAIGDIDDDGSLEAVFWFNEDNNSDYGLLAFDLRQRSIKWVIDNTYAPIASNYILKGQPVLADLNNDNKLEIATSVFYDDLCNVEACGDWFTELFVYNSTGGKLFSRCEKNPSNVDCNDGSSSSSKFEGTNPFILNINHSSFDSVCFIKDKKAGYSFKNMEASCYNYSGDMVFESELLPTTVTVKTAIAADINNDGNNEIITEKQIYDKNGSSILELQFGSNFVVPVDIDGNKGLDLVWAANSQTKVFLDNNNYTIDLSVDSLDISFFKINKTHVNVSAMVNNIGEAEVNGIKTIIYNADTLENNTVLLDIKKGRNATFNAVLGLKENEKVMVSADFDNEINESNEENNFAFKEFIDLPLVFVSADLEPFTLNSKFRDYIKNKLISGYYTTDSGKADVEVYIGKNNPRNKDNNIRTLREFEFGYDYGNVVLNDKTGVMPYSGLAGAFKDDSGRVKIMIAGNEIEGDIAAAKEFIKNQALLLNVKGKEAVFVDDENADAVKVFDYLHLGGNEEHYKLQNEEFKKIVKNALNDEMFNVFDKSVVSSNGITLRLRNLKPNISSDYLEYLNSTGVPTDLPVVLAHGIFSNLTTWEVLGAELSNIGRDTWLIEITGGAGQDCDDCIDYTFYNLTDIFVPALLNGVLSFTGKDKLQYVGFSNGCRAALDSLERNQFDSNKVETFVAVGCPGAFEGNSTLGSVIASRNRDISKNLNSKNINHPSLNQIIKNGLFSQDFLSENKDTKISLNLYKFYEDVIINKNDAQPGNINILNFLIIQGSALTTEDGLVTINDENAIYQNVNNGVNSKKYFDVFALHTGLDNNNRAKSIVKKSINKQELSFYEKTVNLINKSG